MPDTIDLGDLVELLQRRELDRPKVGGAPFGMPYLPPLPPRQEITAPHAVTGLAQRLFADNPNQAYWVDQASALGRDYATGGYNMLDQGMRNAAEGAQEGDALRTAGGVGQSLAGGVAMMPGGGPLRALYGSVPRSLATSTTFGLAPMAAGGFFSTPAEAAEKKKSGASGSWEAPKGPPPDDGLTDQQRARRDELNMKQNRESYLPKAEREELMGINKLSTDYLAKKNADRLEAERVKKAAEDKRKQDEADRLARIAADKAAREEAARIKAEERGKTFAGQHPWTAFGMQMGGAVGGALLGRYIKGVGAREYNSAINDLNSRWQRSVNEGEAAMTAATAGRWNAAKNAQLSRAEYMAEQAQRQQQQIEARREGTPANSWWQPWTRTKGGPTKQWAPLALAVGGSEFGSALPTVIDKSMEGINPNLEDTGLRFAQGLGFGGASGLFASKSGLPLANPAGYTAETAALLRAARALRRRHP